MPLDLLLSNWEYVVGFLGVFWIAFWAFDERDQSESIGDLIERVGERSRSATGGLFGAAGSLGVVAIALISTIGTELVMSGSRIAELIATDPVLAGGVGTALLGTSAHAGLIPIKTWQLVALVGAFLIFGVIWRERQ
jgi:hypothetical protein